MNTATVSNIKQIENSLEVLSQFGIELDLSSILTEEFGQELASDISNGI